MRSPWLFQDRGAHYSENDVIRDGLNSYAGERNVHPEWKRDQMGLGIQGDRLREILNVARAHRTGAASDILKAVGGGVVIPAGPGAPTVTNVEGVNKVGPLYAAVAVT